MPTSAWRSWENSLVHHSRIRIGSAIRRISVGISDECSMLIVEMDLTVIVRASFL
jgi:hypothetical protein